MRHASISGLISKRAICCALCFSALLFVSIIAGYDFDHYGSCFTVSATSILISSVCAGIAFFCVLFLFRMLKVNERFNADVCFTRISSKRFVGTWGIILLAWMPYYLACFPGLYVYDAATQVYYSLGIGVINSFHPLIHTYWLSGFLSLGNYMFGDYTVGFAVYTLSQMLVMSACFAFVLCSLRQLCGRRWVFLVSLAWVCLFPIFPVLAVSATKDAAFSAIFAVFIIQVAKLCKWKNVFIKSKVEVSVLFMSALLSGLFRNNAMYAVAFILLVLVVMHRSNKRFVAVVLTTCLTLLLLLGTLVPKAVSQITSGSGEIFGLPIQQVARTMNLESDSLSQDEKEKVASLIPSWDLYNEHIADPVKFSNGTSQIISSNSASFLRLWVELGLQYPSDYLDAFIAQTEGYWYLFSNYDTVGTTKPYLEADQWEVIEPGVLGRYMGEAGYDAYNALDIENWVIPSKHSLLVPFLLVVEQFCYEPFWMDSFFLRTLTSPALTVWGAVLLILLSLCFRRKELMIPSVAITTYALTCLLGPCYLVRYAFPFYACAPIVLCLFSCALACKSQKYVDSISKLQ